MVSRVVPALTQRSKEASVFRSFETKRIMKDTFYPGSRNITIASGGGGIWALYLSALETNPLATKCFTSGLLNAAGDLFAQFMFENAGEKGCDLRRTGVFTFLGAALVGPCLHFWYGALSKIVAATGAAGTGAAALSLALDQLAFAPTFLAVFIASLFTIEGNAASVPAKLRQDWGETVVTNWKVWVPFQFLNFRFVPVNLQVGAANVIALLWNTYMSWVTHREVVVAKK